MASIRNFRDLIAWQKSMELAKICYALTEGFPPREVYGLANQIRRAAVSIPSNIAEGHQRRSRLAYLNHLGIARGSLAELETQIELSVSLQFMIKADVLPAVELLSEVGRLLNGLIHSLERINPDS